MKKHILKFFYGAIIIIFLICEILLSLLIIEDVSYQYIILMLCFAILILMATNLLIIEFIGKKEYICDDFVLLVKRKEKILYKFYKEEINNLIKVVDCITEDLCSIVFKYKGKKRIIRVSKQNEDSINLFIKELPFSIKKNYFYYLIIFFRQ